MGSVRVYHVQGWNDIPGRMPGLNYFYSIYQIFVIECLQGAPVIMSTPHFLDGDPGIISFEKFCHNYFWNQIWLLQLMELVQIQSFIKHIFILNLSQAIKEILGFTQFYKTKQSLGMPMQAHKRIQISVPLKQSARFDCMNSVTEVTFSLLSFPDWSDR